MNHRRSSEGQPVGAVLVLTKMAAEYDVGQRQVFKRGGLPRKRDSAPNGTAKRSLHYALDQTRPVSDPSIVQPTRFREMGFQPRILNVYYDRHS
jgi:hypothetical protein